MKRKKSWRCEKMQAAIDHYKDILRKKGITNIRQFPICYPDGKAVENIHPQLKPLFNAGGIFLERQEHTDFEIFECELGFPIPKDIAELLNAYWQPGIFGFYKDYPECFMLFSAIRYKDEQPDDFLLHPRTGLISEAKRWVTYDGDPSKYLPVGIYDPTSCYFLLYEVGTGRIFIEDTETEDHHENEPVSESLKELILGLYLK
jgi:hypothetical protein